MKTFMIGLGGALGSIARYQLDGWCQRWLGPSFPYGTLAVNLIGSFLLALLMHVGLTTERIPPIMRIALATGVLGGFTTYSTFNYETLRYLQSSSWVAAFVNVSATVLGCLGAGFLGWVAGRSLVGP